LKNKIFFSCLAILFLLSLMIALLTRWILFTTLTSELKLRGMGIADSIAKSCRSHILTKNAPVLTNLIFDERLGERKYLIAYIFILGKNNDVLAHTFIDNFPHKIITATTQNKNQKSNIRLLNIRGFQVYDVATPVQEGIYEIGSVHVGLKKEHIDNLMAKLRITFLGFLSLITILFFWISNLLSKYITRPITELIKISDEISHSNLDITIKSLDEIKEISDKEGRGDEVMQLAYSFNNMTQRLRLSRKNLRESEDKYRSLFNSGPNPIFVFDRKTLEILDINPSAEETYSYLKEQMAGKFFNDLGRFEYEDQEKNPVEIVKKGWPKGYILNTNVSYYPINASQPYYLRAKICPTEYKDRDALILAVTDITEMVEQEVQLIQASKMTTLGQMSAGIAHELNQPLNAIKLGNDYLSTMVEKGRSIPDNDIAMIAHEVNAQVDRASEIINLLRQFGRKTDFAKEKVNINSTIRNVLVLIGKQLNINNISINLELSENIPGIMAHNNRIEQVLFNLISNARDAICLKNSGERKITIKTFQEKNNVVLIVSDTGTGISDEIKEKIFNPFFTIKEVGKGMGLGTTLNEIALQSNVGIRIDEHSLPIKGPVQGICELLGFDPLYIANEGKLIAFVPERNAQKVLEVIQQDEFGKDAVIIGEVTDKDPGKVFLQTRIGGLRIVDMLTGEQLPRIC